MFWTLITKGRFTSGSNGETITYVLDTQDWGLRVKDVNYAVVVTGRSSSNAKFKLTHKHGATPLVAAMASVTDPISFTQVNTQLPKTYTGAYANEVLPFFVPSLEVGVQAGATEEYVEIELYAGGKQF